MIEEPWITIDAIASKKTGENFLITGQTNLSVNNEVLVEVTPKNVPPGAEMYRGIRGITKIINEEGGINSFSFTIELIDTRPGEYVVNVISHKIGVFSSQSFIVT